MKRLIEIFYYTGPKALDERRLARIRPPRNLPVVAYYHCFGLLFNPKALWIGAHYSEHHKRLCVNLVPCLTVWWTKPGGYLP